MSLGPLMIDIEGLCLSVAEREQLGDPRVGGVILFSRNFADREQLASLVAEIHAVRTPSLLVAVDQEGGRVQRFRDGFSALPPARWLGHEYDIDPEHARRLAEMSGWLMAAELLDVGIDLSFAPVVDLDWGLSDVIGDRALHREPEAVISLAFAYIAGMRKAGMAAVAKHFPGHGGVVADSHHELPVDMRTAGELERDLMPYEHLIANGLTAVMVAHIRFPRIDRRVASLSPYWLQTELRQRLEFNGVIFSDDLNMAATESCGTMPERVRQALSAGADMALICNNAEGVTEVLAELTEAVDPVRSSRLVTLRPHRAAADGPPLNSRDEWQAAVAALAGASARPQLKLDG